MRVLFTASDYAAHYFPMVPLGWALQAAGHEVRVACAPGETAKINSAGLTPVPILGGPDMMVRGRIFYYFAAQQQGGKGELGMPLHPVTGKPVTGFGEFNWPAYKQENQQRNIAAIKQSFDNAVAFAREWKPTFVVHDLLSSEGVLAAKVTGVPSACHLWGAVGTDEDEPGVALVPPDHTGTFERYGLPPMSADLIDHVIDPCPASVGAPSKADRLPVRFVPYNGPGTQPDWALERPAKPRVCVIWGNSLSALLGPVSAIVPKILDALSGLDVEVVVTMSPEAAAELGPVPSNVRVLEYCPLKLLLPTCDAVVYHGGAGCGMTAAAAGTPQLALPFTPEQNANARRLVSTGAGIRHHGPAVDGETIREAVRALIEDPAYRAAAAALAEEMLKRPSPAELVRDLEELAGGS